MSKLDEITEKVSASYASKGYSINPMTIIFIAGLILDLIKLVMSCYNKSDYDKAVSKINNPSMIDKFTLKRRMKTFARANKSDVNLDQLKDSLLSVKLNIEDFNELIIETDKYRG
jgi:hypothetical protein